MLICYLKFGFYLDLGVLFLDALYIKVTLRGNGGRKPKPTAYEKTFIVRTYLISIFVAGVLTSAFFGRFNVNTPLM